MSIVSALGVGWGALLLLLVRSWRRRLAPAARSRALTWAPPDGAATSPERPGARVTSGSVGGRTTSGVRRLMLVLSGLAGRRRERAERLALAREVPVAIDLVGVAVGAGCTPYLALETAVRWSPDPIADELAEVLRGCCLGLSFEDSLRRAAHGSEALRPLAAGPSRQRPLRQPGGRGAHPAGPRDPRRGSPRRRGRVPAPCRCGSCSRSSFAFCPPSACSPSRAGAAGRVRPMNGPRLPATTPVRVHDTSTQEVDHVVPHLPRQRWPRA